MNKNKEDKRPEVGDVWEFAGKPIHVKEITEDEIYYVEEDCSLSMSSIITSYDTLGNFLDRSTYLGKSKANINDLFEVRDEL